MLSAYATQPIASATTRKAHQVEDFKTLIVWAALRDAQLPPFPAHTNSPPRKASSAPEDLRRSDSISKLVLIALAKMDAISLPVDAFLSGPNPPQINGLA